MSELRVGDRLNNRYRIVQPLGRGGMGSVYLAEDLAEDNRAVALKLLGAPGHPGGPRAGFLKREFSALRELRHPHLAAAFDFGVASLTGELFFTQEYIPGLNLLEACQPLLPGDSSQTAQEQLSPWRPALETPPPEVRTFEDFYDVLVQICRCLEYIHSRNLVHNDVKPENIIVSVRTPARPNGSSGGSEERAGSPERAKPRPFDSFPIFDRDARSGRGLEKDGLVLSERGETKSSRASRRSGTERVEGLSVKVIDFGLSCELTATADLLLKGTPHYLAPELIEGESPSSRSDLYALGVTLYRVLAGRFPFESSNLRQLLKEHLSSSVPSLRQRNSRVPYPLEDLVLRLLAKNPADRFDRPNELIRQISLTTGRPYELETAETKQSYVLSARHSGRRKEAEELRQAFRSVVSATETPIGSAPVAVLVEGEAGMGKSRLVGELKSYAQLEGIHAFMSSSYRHVGEPFGVFVEILRSVVAQILPELGVQGDELRQRYDRDLARVLPELASDQEAPAGVADPQWERMRLALVLSEFLLETARQIPLFVWLNDLQWADLGSFELLSTLVRDLRRSGLGSVPPVSRGLPKAKRPRLSLCVTYRPGELPAGRAQKLLEELSSFPEVRRITLRELGAAEIQELLSSMLGGQGVAEEIASDVLRKTSGNPAFVQEFMRAMAEASLPAGAPAEAGPWKLDANRLTQVPIPHSVTEVLARRLGALSEPSRRVLERLAIWNRPVTVFALESWMGPEEGGLLPVLGELVQQGFLSRLAGAEGARFEFSSAAHREAVLGQIPESQRAELHRQVGAWIEQELGEHAAERAAELAYHFRAAGDFARAEPYSLEAAEKAWRVGDLPEAEKWYGWALESAQARSDAAAQTKAHEHLADVAETLGDYPRALEHYQKARELLAGASGTLAGGASGTFESASGTFESASGTFAGLRSPQGEAEARSLEASPGGFAHLPAPTKVGAQAGATAGRLAIKIGIVLARQGQRERAARQLQEIIETREAGVEPGSLDCLAPLELARMVAAVADAAYHTGNSPIGKEIAERGLAVLDRSAEAPAESRPFGASKDELRVTGPSEQRVTGEVGRRTGERQKGGAEARARMLSALGLCQLGSRQLKEALGSLEAAEPLAEEAGDLRLTSQIANHMGLVYHESGDNRLAVSHFQKSLEAARKGKDLLGTLKALNNLGIGHQYLGDLDQAVDCQQQCRDYSERLGLLESQALALSNLGSLYLLLGDLGRAREFLQKGAEIFEKIGDRRQYPLNLYNQAQLQSLRGEFVESMALLDRAEELFGEQNQPVGDMVVKYLRGRNWWLLGAPERASAELRACIERARRLGNEIWVAYCLEQQGLLAATQKNRSVAVLCFQEALALAERAGARLLLPLLLVRRAEQILESGNWQKALKLCKRAEPEIERMKIREFRALLYFVQGKLFQRLGLSGMYAALEHLHKALSEAQILGSPEIELGSLGELARVYAALGNPESARDFAARAIHRIDRLGESLPPDLRKIYRDDPRRKSILELGRVLGVQGPTVDGREARPKVETSEHADLDSPVGDREVGGDRKVGGAREPVAVADSTSREALAFAQAVADAQALRSPQGEAERATAELSRSPGEGADLSAGLPAGASAKAEASAEAEGTAQPPRAPADEPRGETGLESEAIIEGGEPLMQETTSSGENARPEQGPIEDRTESKGEALSMRVLQSTLALHAEKNLTRLVAMVTDQLRELFGAEQAAVWLLEDRPLGDPADAFPFGEMTSSIHAGLAQAMGAEVLRTGRPVVSPAVGKDARWDKSLRPAFVPIAIGTPADRSAPFVGSAAAFPLRSPQRVLGILYLEHSSREGIFSLDAETLLTLYADQVAVAVEAVLEILRTTTDELTGALTHSSFQAVLDRWLGISRRRRSPLAVVTIDLDQFRMTNEQFGADAGNSILREVSSLIRDKAAAVETRSAGPVGAPRGLCGRYEGDEFEVVLPGMGRPEARHFALKLLEELGTLSGAARPGRPGVSASAGIAIYPEDADAKDGLILKAHEAMREAKRNGRARVVSWGDPAEAATSKTLASTDPEIGSMLVSRDGMTVLGMVNRLLQAGLDLDKTLDLALEMMIEVTKAERGFVVLATAAGEPEVRCARGMNREEIGKPRFRPSFGIVKQVLERGEAVLIPDTLRDARVSDKSSVMNLELRSILSVPIRLEQRLLGAVYLDTRSLEKQFSEEDRDLLAAFARKIARSIANLIEYRDSLKELDRLKETLAEGLQELQTKYSYENIVGKSKEMRKVFQLLDRVTDTSYSVMIYGESGTGKELIAKAIHFNGPRKAKPFVAENCGAIAETLLESELFGHMRGSFTGADQDRKGLFEIASGGTLFLDEISEMSPLMQKKLLRVIEESEIRPVGGKRCIRIDTRIIAASNKNLKGLMERGSFREDLYYRLAVIAILLPALRTRKEDIPLLVEHFLNVAAQGAPSRRKKIDRGALAGLLRHDWPGNVRELKNTIERAVVLCEGSTILPKHIVFEAERGMMSLGEMLPERTPAGAAFAGAAGGQETAGMRSPSGVALSDRQQKLIERLRVAPSITNREYAALVGVSVPTAWRDLSELETAGLIARSGRGRNSTYHLPGRLPRSEP